MKPIKLVHLSDVHYRPENKREALESLRVATEKGQKEAVDLFVIAGDLFDRGIQNSENAGLPELQAAIQAMMNIAPVIAVEGTRTHDIPGCYRFLEETIAKHEFVVLDPRCRYYLIGKTISRQTTKPLGNPHADLLILGCPEPGKEWFLSDKQLGKDEADEAIKDGMRGLLLGFAAIRKEHPDIPCIMVYHGMIAGSSLQNGQVLPAGGIQIGRDDLALIEAVYYALGHIHLAQQIGELPAYYPGSAYPITWGETDQKYFNLVEFKEDRSTKVEFIKYPHPPRIKLERTWPNIMGDGKGVAGKQAWLEIKVPKEQRNQINENLILSKMLDEWGALEGSRVTVSVIPTETVRAAQIQSVKSLREKIRVYADVSSEKIPGAAMDKADELEQEARKAGAIGEGLHIRIKRLSLRGAIGIWKGTGKDEIDLDLAQYDPGLIALIGPNGAGKSTLIENMHPFPELLTRSGKLQDHFRLRDSYRDLYFTDNRTRDEYRAFIQIDGTNKTGKCEYFLYRNGGPLTNGRKEEYEQKVSELFGSLGLYLRSAFVTQKSTKNNPDLAEAAKGEKKSIFREIGGLEYLQQYSELSRERAKTIESELATDRGKIEILEQTTAGLPDRQAELQQKEGELKTANQKETDASVSVKALEKQVEELREKMRKNFELENKVEEKKSGVETLENEVTDIEEIIEVAQESIAVRADAERKVKEYENLQATERGLQEERNRIYKERERVQGEYQVTKNTAEDAMRTVQVFIDEKNRTVSDLEHGKIVLLTQIDHLEARLEEKVECPKCGNRFSIGQDADQAKLKATQEKVWEIDKHLAVLDGQIGSLAQEKAQIKYPEIPELPEFREALLAKLTDQMNQLNINLQREILAKVGKAEAQIEEGRKRVEKNKERIKSLATEIFELELQTDSDIGKQFDDKARELKTEKGRHDQIKEACVRLRTELVELKKQIDALEKQKAELRDLKAEIAQKQNANVEWKYLERACGPDGIQALELDAMGPSIADVANRLLQAAYGSRFQIEFRTTRIGGSGSKTKQIEDFQIVIIDSETGDEQLLETLSGGESVWIKNVVYTAFGIIRDRNTGQRFLTVFLDEADGQLDPEARLHYIKMIDAAHQEAGRAHTIVVTHSTEAQEYIAQKIKMEDFHVSVQS